METQEKKSYLRHLPDSAAAFIKQVIKKMRYRKEVRSEVMAELAAHFEDELKDCKTDQEKQQKAEQLITDFGDVKLLAVLLRRAQKRCRPLWRTIVTRSFQTVGVLILCFIVYVVWFLTGKPIITTNYVAELNNMVRPVADESLNAAPLYLKAVELHEELSDDFLLFLAENHKVIVDEKFPRKVEMLAGKIDRVLSNREQPNFQKERKDIQDEVYNVLSQFMREKYNELTVEQRSMVKRWVQEHNDALELIIEGSRKPYYWRTYKSHDENSSEMMSVLIPNLSDFRKLAYSLRWRALLSVEQGRFKDAFVDMRSCYRLGQHIRGDKTLVEQLVGIAIQALSVRTIREIVGGYEIDSTMLADLQRNFEQIINDENYAISFKAEKLCMYDEIQRCFTSDRIGKGHLYLPRFRKISVLAGSHRNEENFEDFIVVVLYSGTYLFRHPNKEETRVMADRCYAFWDKIARKSSAQIHAEGIDIEKEAMKIIKGNILLEILLPALGRVNEISNRVPTEVGATLTMIAIFRYKRDTGRFPQNLNQLVTAGYLKQLPIDSFSDKPLVYKITGDDFILYSFGHNCANDGGEPGRDEEGRLRKWGENGDQVFWPVPKPQLEK